MNNKSKQKLAIKNQKEGSLRPKRFVSMVVDYLNSRNYKSLNGGIYNYQKVYQVLIGRWTDENVSLAESAVMLSLKKAEIEKAKISKEIERLDQELAQV